MESLIKPGTGGSTHFTTNRENRMKRCLGCITLLLLLCDQATAEPPAGVVVYFESGGEAYLLLAEHAGSKRGWAGFGGSHPKHLYAAGVIQCARVRNAGIV